MYTALARTVCGIVLVAGFVNMNDPEATASGDALSAVVRQAVDAAPPVGEASLADDAGPDGEKLFRVYRVTAYHDRGVTAAGVRSGVGQCAAPADIPFGAEIYVPALDQTFVVTDRTAKRFRHNTVDIFIPSRRDCLEFGCNYLECEITLPERPLRYASRSLRSLVAAVR